LTPKVIVEPLLFQGGDVLDYRFFCVNGTAKLIVVDVDWTGDKRRLIFDSEWAAQPYTISHPPSTATLPKPSNFDEMRRIAEALASRFNFIRIDLYSDGKTCQVGEITNCHGGVTATFIPPEAEREASKLLFG
ncbi:MAG TPA: ATP-grasp fold amidoligase family protein, partial [Croceibacterium sp.]|nr:ATP-grasp fold amidoligase family protein [Croceibacterium sp.]